MRDEEAGTADGITIAEIASLAELEEYQAVERTAWTSSDLELVPAHVVLTHQRYGGLVLGAREPGGEMIGMLLGFPGLKAGHLVHCSHLLGIRPEWRGHDVGYRMKRYQREFVLAQGLDLVVWTYDPLETRNARLNIGRLGGIARDYNPNLYGTMQDGLNQGLESDRLTVEWHIRHPAIAARLAGTATSPEVAALLASGTPLLTRTRLLGIPHSGAPLLALDDVVVGAEAPRLLVEAPVGFQALKAADPSEARRWRFGIRGLLQDLFTRGYGVLDVLYARDAMGQLVRCYYLLGEVSAFLRQDADRSR